MFLLNKLFILLTKQKEFTYKAIIIQRKKMSAIKQYIFFYKIHVFLKNGIQDKEEELMFHKFFFNKFRVTTNGNS